MSGNAFGLEHWVTCHDFAALPASTDHPRRSGQHSASHVPPVFSTVIILSVFSIFIPSPTVLSCHHLSTEIPCIAVEYTALPKWQKTIKLNYCNTATLLTQNATSHCKQSFLESAKPRTPRFDLPLGKSHELPRTARARLDTEHAQPSPSSVALNLKGRCHLLALVEGQL